MRNLNDARIISTTLILSLFECLSRFFLPGLRFPNPIRACRKNHVDAAGKMQSGGRVSDEASKRKSGG